MYDDEPQPTQHEIGKRTYLIAPVAPLDIDGVRTTEVGTAVWLIAFVALLPFYGRLEEDGHLWWLWTCLAGFGLGGFGMEYCRRRRKARLARQPGAPQ
jgi:hypothetical protein